VRISITAPGFSFLFLNTLVSTASPFDTRTFLVPRGQPEPLQATVTWPPAATPDTTSFLTFVYFGETKDFANLELDE